MNKMNLIIEKKNRSFCVMAGKSALGKFRTLEAAEKSLIEDAALYSYWAGCVSVSVENTEQKIIKLLEA